MKRNPSTILMSSSRELHLSNLHSYTNDKYKPDTLLLHGAVSYLLMIGCVVIDISFFKSLFQMISYDSPMMIWLQVAGLAFGADVVAAYAGLLAKRIRQGMSHETLNLILLLFVPVFALIVNGVLRCSTMSLLKPDGEVTAMEQAQTMIAIVTPVFTSIGNFCISYLSYDPLAQRMQMEEQHLDDIRDLRRRISALITDFTLDENCEERLVQLDNQHLANAKKELMNTAMILCSEVRTKLMEQLGDPASTNVLSQSQCDAIYQRLTAELSTMDKTCTVPEVEPQTISLSLTEAA